MSHPASASPEPLRRYLLGQLGQEEAERLDRELLAEDEALAYLESAQDDLIEDYLDGALAADEQAAFEDHFLASPPHRHSLECARMIRAHALRDGQGRRVLPFRPRLALPWLGAIAAVLLAAIWVGTPEGPPTPPVTRGAARPAGIEPSPLPATTTTVPESAPLVANVDLVVSNLMAPGGAGSTLKLDPRAETVRFTISVGEGTEAYRELAAELVPGEGAPLAWKQVRPRETVVLSRSAQEVPPGRYILILTGWERDGGPAVELDRWDLTVEKR